MLLQKQNERRWGAEEEIDRRAAEAKLKRTVGTCWDWGLGRKSKKGPEARK